MAKVRVTRRKETGEMEELDLKPEIMTEEAAELIGRQSEPVIIEVERGAIKRYAQAIEDPNPLYNDVEYARKSRYGELICPPGFTGWPVKPRDRSQASLPAQVMEKTGRSTMIDNGGEIEFILPIRAGDTITSVNRVNDIYEEVGRSGNRLLLGLFETTYVNQNGDIAARSNNRILYL